MGAITTMPSYFGLSLSAEQKKDYIHFWRCLGYQLGIADEFNLCSAGPPTTDVIVDEIWREMVLPGLRNPPAEYATMTRFGERWCSQACGTHRQSTLR
jgi:hypothetical protein